MYCANKTVGWILSPLGLFFLGVLAGVLSCRVRRFRVLGVALAALAVAQLWFFGCGVTTRLIGVPLEGDEVAEDLASCPACDAIVLLGGGIGLHEKCGRSELYAGADRAWMAARLFNAGKAPRVTVSGAGAPGEVAFLSDLGVATNAVVVLADPRNTAEEAREIRRALGASSAVPRILLVTSAWHMPRAKMLFERAGLDVVPAPTDYEMHGVAEHPLGFGDFMPNADALWRNSAAVKEWVARFLYGVRDRLMWYNTKS